MPSILGKPSRRKEHLNPNGTLWNLPLICLPIFVLRENCQSASAGSLSNIKTWWRHEMETFSALLAICAGNSPVPVNSPHKGQWRGALMFSLICVWINSCVNSREADDLRRHRGHYDVSVKNLISRNLVCPWLCSQLSNYIDYFCTEHGSITVMQHFKMMGQPT